MVPNHGVIIEEINDEEEEHQDAAPGGPIAVNEPAEEEIGSEDEEEVSIPNESDGEGGDDIFWDGLAKQTMFSDETNMEEMYSITPFAEPHPLHRTLKRKAWFDQNEKNRAFLKRGEVGESSSSGVKKKKAANCSTRKALLSQ
ncbi:Uncharacterized protein Rs2_09163 [Raphanus sativus]|nr:Uncharacterized protein Rs2_09163 [Raphanus sativus]